MGECPGSNDVVFRQGTSSMENPGNVKCRDLVLSLLEDRDNALKDNNNSNFSNGSSWNNNNNAARIHNEIVDQLVNQIECQRHGRFLEWDKHRGAWIQIDGRPKVKQKVSVLLHSIGKRYRKTVAPTTTSSNSNSNSNSRIRKLPSHQIESDPVVSNDEIPIISTSVADATMVSIDSSRESPSLMDFDAMVIKSDDEADAEELGPYSFMDGGSSFRKQQQCCRFNDDFASQQRNRKRLKQV